MTLEGNGIMFHNTWSLYWVVLSGYYANEEAEVLTE